MSVNKRLPHGAMARVFLADDDLARPETAVVV
jgi:hypothetical protein